MKLYFAGPDVFRPDALAWAAAARALCARHGHEALLPLDGDATTASEIYAANVAMIRRADAVLARLSSFRGAEPDSGTCFEVGYAVALGKPVVGYLDSPEPLRDRVARLAGPLQRCAASGQWRDRDGQAVEDFDLPLNLMLAVPVPCVAGDMTAALARLEAMGAAAG